MIHRFFLSNMMFIIAILMMTMQSCCVVAFAPTSSSMSSISRITSSKMMTTSLSSSSSYLDTITTTPFTSEQAAAVAVPLVSSPSTHDTTLSIAATTVDPTTALSQVLGGLLGSPAILLIPVLAAFTVASAIAWFIVSYANPADPDDD